MKIDIPQLLVSYLGGSGGEWLAIKMAQHDKYYHPDMKFEVSEYNRWRLRSSWRGAMLNTPWKQLVWLGDNMNYDGTAEWWNDFWKRVPDQEYWYDQVRELHKNSHFTVGVHRVHEAWCDQYWRDLFTDFKTVTIHVDVSDKETAGIFRNNIIKKIMWQDLAGSKLTQEVQDKCQKYKVDFNTVMEKLNRMPDVKWCDTMLVILSEIPHIKQVFQENLEGGMDHVLANLSSRWDSKNTQVYSKHIPGGITVDFKRLIIDQSYTEYLKICDYTGATPWKETLWNKAVVDYASPDVVNQIVTYEDLQERLWERAIMII